VPDLVLAGVFPYQAWNACPRPTVTIRLLQEISVFKNDGAKLWLNRVLWLAAGGLIVLVVMSVASVTPLKSRNTALTTQLDELQNGAVRLLTEAQAQVANKSYGAAQQTLVALFDKHPGSDQATEGKKLSAEIAAMVALRDQKWLASMGAVKTAWETAKAAELRAQADAVRQQVEVTMADTLNTQWQQSVDRVRQQWENGEI